MDSFCSRTAYTMVLLAIMMCRPEPEALYPPVNILAYVSCMARTLTIVCRGASQLTGEAELARISSLLMQDPELKMSMLKLTVPLMAAKWFYACMELRWAFLGQAL